MKLSALSALLSVVVSQPQLTRIIRVGIDSGEGIGGAEVRFVSVFVQVNETAVGGIFDIPGVITDTGTGAPDVEVAGAVALTGGRSGMENNNFALTGETAGGGGRGIFPARGAVVGTGFIVPGTGGVGKTGGFEGLGAQGIGRHGRKYRKQAGKYGQPDGQIK